MAVVEREREGGGGGRRKRWTKSSAWSKWYSNNGLVHSLEHLFDPLEHAEELVDETDVSSVFVDGKSDESKSPK